MPFLLGMAVASQLQQARRLRRGRRLERVKDAQEQRCASTMVKL